MRILTTLLAALGLLGLLGQLFNGLLAWRFARSLRGATVEQLEEQAFRYEREYFDFIGHDTYEAQEFRKLIESRDLKGLRERWGDLAPAFEQYEYAASHKGAPLLMDHYGFHRVVLRALATRRLSQN